MMIAPDIDQADTNSPEQLQNVQVPLSERFSSAASSALENTATVGALEHQAGPSRAPLLGFGLGAPQIDLQPTNESPITKEQTDQITNTRPGLKIPDGTAPSVANAMADRYDSSVANEYIGSHVPPGLLSKISGFAGGVVGSTPDVLSLVGGAAAASAIPATLGTRILAGMGVDELMGSSAASVGSKILQHSLQGAAGFGGYQAVTEAGQAANAADIDQDYDWVQGAKNVANSLWIGGLTGGALSAAMETIKNIHASRTASASTASGPSASTGNPGAPIVEGELQGMPGTNISTMPAQDVGLPNQTGTEITKPLIPTILGSSLDVIKNNFQLITPEAEQAAKISAMAQMAGGIEPNVEPILKQGVADAQANFKKVLQDNDIDPNKLRQDLQTSKENLRSQMEQSPNNPDLMNADMVHDTLIHYLGDDFDGANPDDMKYFQAHLESEGLTPDPIQLPDEQTTKPDEQLHNVDDSDVHSMIDHIGGNDELHDEFDQTNTAIKNQGVYQKMVNNIIKCFLGGGE